MNAENTLALVFSMSCRSACSTPSRISVKGASISSTGPNSLEIIRVERERKTAHRKAMPAFPPTQDAHWAVVSVSPIVGWKASPFHTHLLPAGSQRVSKEDGAGPDEAAMAAGHLSHQHSPLPLPQEDKQQSAHHRAEAEAVDRGWDQELR